MPFYGFLKPPALPGVLTYLAAAQAFSETCRGAGGESSRLPGITPCAGL